MAVIARQKINQKKPSVHFKDLLEKSPLAFKKEFESLIEGNSIEKFINEQMAFQYLDNNPEATWSLLLMAGYLKPTTSRRTDQGIFAELAIPNREVRNLYRQMIERWLSNDYGIGWYNQFIETLLEGKIEEFKGYLENVLFMDFHSNNYGIHYDIASPQ